MRDWNFRRIFRCLICLVLICAFLVNFSPIKAHADAVTGAVAASSKIIYLTAPLGVQIFGWVLLGLGLAVSTANMIKLCNEFQQYSEIADVSIYYFPDGSWSYGVDLTFVQKVHAWLFNAGYFVTAGVPISSGSITLADGRLFKLRTGTFTYSVVSYSISVSPAKIHGELCWWPYQQGNVTSYQFSVNNGNYLGGNIVYVNDVQYRYWFFENASLTSAPYYGSFSPNSSTSTSAEQNFVKAFISAYESGKIVTGIEGADLGQVCPQEVPLPDGYPDWYSNSRPVVRPDEEIQVLPIPFDPNSDIEGLPGGANQPGAWAGSIADPLPGMEPDPNPDPDPGTDPDSGSGSGSGSWTPPKIPMSVDLTQFFPFCIPFDLFEFFKLLHAEPVAPVLYWEMADLAGQTYSISIDLSEWDSVAQLFRRLQLFLFICGLAVASRKFIKW